jgi:pimeloyl-ACP methyl ester carboxylesterase
MALHLNAYISCFATFSQDVPHLQRLRQEKLSMSVLAMGADHSRGAEMGQQVEQYATHVRSVVIADSGHWLPEEHPQEVVQHLLSFFAK